MQAAISCYRLCRKILTTFLRSRSSFSLLWKSVKFYRLSTDDFATITMANWHISFAAILDVYLRTKKDIGRQSISSCVSRDTFCGKENFEQDLKLKEIKPRIVNQHSVVYCFKCDLWFKLRRIYDAPFVSTRCWSSIFCHWSPPERCPWEHWLTQWEPV